MIYFVLLSALLYTVQGQRIASGNPVTIQKYPYAVALLSNEGVGSYELKCGGTVLTTNAILSAAGCFFSDGSVDPPTWWRARVGSSSGNSDGTTYMVRQITVHPDYSQTLREHDVAVIRTSLLMNYAQALVGPATLSGAAYRLSDYHSVWAVGWGDAKVETSSALRDVEIFIVEQPTCVNRYRGTGYSVTDNVICAGWLDVGVRGQCETAGSPLVVDNMVVGIYSWTEGACAHGWYPNINTKVSSYIQWIVATARATL